MYIQEKIVSKLQSLGTKTFSIEVVPPLLSAHQENDALDIVARISSRALFISITWHARRNPPWSETCATLDFTKLIFSNIKPAPTVLVNLVCIGQTIESIKRILDELVSLGICNVFIIHGESPDIRDPGNFGSSSSSTTGDFLYASQLVAFIRSYSGDYFCIGVAGYPDMNKPEDWECVSQKVALGADFIITQILLEPSSYIKYVDKCRKLGIKVPILPGIMPIVSYQSFNFIRKLTKSPMPLKVQSTLVKLNDDPGAINDFGISYARDLCISISCNTNLFHFFTLNKKYHLLKLLHLLRLLK